MPLRPSRPLTAFVRWLAAISFLLGGARHGVAAETEARSAKQVLIIQDRPSDPFADRLRAEIEGMGLRTVVLQADRVEQMEVAAREQHAAAAIRLVPSRRGVEIWMADETSGRSLLRQLIVDERPDGPDENLVAMQLVELLRTSLLVEPRSAQPPARPIEPERPMEVEEPPPQVSTCTWCARVQTGVGALVSPGGGGPALQALLSLQMMGQAMGVALDLAAPLRDGKVSGPEGTASLGPSLVGVAVLRRLIADQRSPLSATAGLGLAVLHISTNDAKAIPPLVANPPDATTMGAGYARFDFGVGFTHWLRLTLRITGGMSFSRLQIQFAGNQAANWGRLFGAGAVVLDAGW